MARYINTPMPGQENTISISVEPEIEAEAMDRQVAEIARRVAPAGRGTQDGAGLTHLDAGHHELAERIDRDVV